MRYFTQRDDRLIIIRDRESERFRGEEVPLGLYLTDIIEFWRGKRYSSGKKIYDWHLPKKIIKLAENTCKQLNNKEEVK